MLFAARDRFGIKPLFYAWHDDTLYLASEVKALFAAGVPARWDPRVLLPCDVEFGGHQMRTLFDGVFQVPPGHYLARHRPACRRSRAIGISTIRRRTIDDRSARDADYVEQSFARRWKRRFACGCAPTCRSAAI